MRKRIAECVKAHRETRKITAPLQWASRRRQTAGPKRRPQVTPRLPRRRCVTRQAAFLAAYRKTASIPSAAKAAIPSAAKAAGIRPAQHYRWLASDAAYWQAFAEVQEDVTGILQDTALGRIRDGWVKPLLYRGRVCGTIRTHPVRLHLFLLKAWIPEKWGSRTFGG
jgi:hypothetical protein